MHKKPQSIAEETVILPDLVASSVVQEAARYLYTNHGTELLGCDSLATKLADKAEAIYKARPDIRARFLKNATYGRDWLYCFMRHWLAAELKDSRLPASFANGLPI